MAYVMRFTKMHGAGNDYIYVDCLEVPEPADPPSLARAMADRHFGIGGDGLVLICPSRLADARMRMFNADGSESEMCGNAIRCVGKYLFDRGVITRPYADIETGAGVLHLELEVEHDEVRAARVDMGRPRLSAVEIPTTLPGDPVVDVPLSIAGRELRVTCVSMGNPHCVTFVERLSDELVQELGPQIEVDAHFPRKVNAEFVEVLSPHEIRVRVWERGSGETLACGTGASAACVAGVLSGRTDRRVTIHLLGGDLELEWGDDDHVYKSGPAVEVFEGRWLGPGG